MFVCIKNANVYAPRELGIQDVLLCFDRIVAIAPKIESYPLETTVIDADGRTMIPGLIDQHVHVTGGGGESGFASRVPEIQLSDIARAGVTTLVGLLGTDSRTRSVENLVAKVKALGAEGITAYCLTGAYEYPSPTLTGSVADDILFISEVLGVKLAISDHRSSNLSREDLIRLASQARLAGLLSKKPGVVHMHTGAGQAGLSMVLDILDTTDIPVKVFRPTHMKPSLEEDCVAFAARGGYLDYTSGGNPEAAAAAIFGILDRGVPAAQITLSSDSNGSMPRWGENKEIIGITAAKMTSLFAAVRALVAAGMSLEMALGFVTTHVAKALELYPRKGVLAAGSDADFVLLDGHMNIETVFAKGEALLLFGQAMKKGLFEE